jgi:small subunit ribosomal protein S8
MILTDPIADMLNRIHNAYRVGKSEVLIPASKFKLAVAKVLQDAGYIESVEQAKQGAHEVITVTLRYNPQPAVQFVSRISRPGQRIYASKQEIPRFLQGYGTVIISTPKGVMTGEQARRAGLGGELICKVS